VESKTYFMINTTHQFQN